LDKYSLTALAGFVAACFLSEAGNAVRCQPSPPNLAFTENMAGFRCCRARAREGNGAGRARENHAVGCRCCCCGQTAMTVWCPEDYHMALGGAVQAGLREHYVQQVAQVRDLLKTAAEWQMVVYRDKGKLCLMASHRYNKLVAKGKLESDQSIH
jgi:hypothetical protein